MTNTAHTNNSHDSEPSVPVPPRTEARCRVCVCVCVDVRLTFVEQVCGLRYALLNVLLHVRLIDDDEAVPLFVPPLHPHVTVPPFQLHTRHAVLVHAQYLTAQRQQRIMGAQHTVRVVHFGHG